MTLAYIMDGGLFDVPGAGADLYDRFPTFRSLYDQIASWVEVPTDRLLRWELPHLHEYRAIGAIRQAAIALGICDLMAERGIRPDATTGISLGGMVSACVAGSVERRDLFVLLAQLRHAPGPTGPAQGAAALAVPADVDVHDVLEGPHEGVYIAVESGVSSSRGHQVFVLTGYLAALTALAEKLPGKIMQVLPDISVAFHSPLSGYLQDFLEPHIAEVFFQDPAIPMASCMEPRMLATADDVRDMFLRNQTTTVSLPHMLGGLVSTGTQLAVLVGPGDVRRFPATLPFPIIHVETVDQLLESLGTIYEITSGSSIGI